MKKKRLTRDKGWGFQHFPYYQQRVDMEGFHGMVSLICLVDGETLYWHLPKAGKAAVAGAGMCWLQMLPDDTKRMITAKFLPEGTVSVWYVDVIEGTEYAEDGVLIYEDKYLDVIFTPQGDVEVVDRDELDEAYHSGELTEKQHRDALEEGERILKELCSDIGATHRLCIGVLEYVRQKIASGDVDFRLNTAE